VTGGVVEEVREDLGEPHGVRVEKDGRGGALDGELVPAGFEQRPAGLDGLVEDGQELDGFLAQRELAVGNA
jgi:hypothetical protein